MRYAIKFYVRFSTFIVLHFRKFTVAINPIPVKILSRESVNVFGTAADGILSTHLVFLLTLKYIPRLVYPLRRGMTNETIF